MFERADELPFEAGFEPGEDPDAAERKIQTQLRKLAYADVDIVVGDEPRKSGELFAADDYGTVVTFLLGKSNRTAADYNDLGCAHAWERDWKEARASLKQSDEAGNDEEKTRAAYNLGVVKKAQNVEKAQKAAG